jgi:phenylalanyl-tRNA synthetase beta chain
LHPDVLENFGIVQNVYYFEIDFEKLVNISKEAISVTPPSRYPDSIRDIAMLVDDEVSFKMVLESVTSLKIKEIEDVDIFDLYKGEHVPPSQKSIAIRVRYRSHEKTLTDDEVARLHERVVKHLINALKATIR